MDREGQPLLDLPIAADRVSDITDHDERQFAVVVPWSLELERSLTRIRVRDAVSPLVSATRIADGALAGTTTTDLASTIGADTRGRTRVQWNARAYPMVMARDAATGDILGFLRNSGDAFNGGGRAVELVYSDGVRSVVRRH